MYVNCHVGDHARPQQPLAVFLAIDDIAQHPVFAAGFDQGTYEHHFARKLHFAAAGQIDFDRDRFGVNLFRTEIVGIEEGFEAEVIDANDPHDGIARGHPFAQMPINLDDDAVDRRDRSLGGEC